MDEINVTQALDNDIPMPIEDNTFEVVDRVIVAPVEQEERVTESSNSILSEEDEAFLNEVIENQHLEIPSIAEEAHDETARFSGAEWFNKIQEKVIIVGGAGGISSNTIFQLTRVHPKSLYIFDDDTVEEVNLAGQMFNNDSVGKKKVDAIANIVKDFCRYESTFAMPERYTEDSFTADIMKARKVFFNNWCKHVNEQKDKSNCLFIDARLSFDTLQVFTITGDDEFNKTRYEKEFLFSDEEADETICSLKQTTFMACMIASFIVNNVVNFCANELTPMIKQLPFFIEYDSNLMYLKESE